MPTPEQPGELNYVDDTRPGNRHKKLRGKFCYLDAQGQRSVDRQQIARCNALAVPPAYTDVWIYADPNDHLQATGRDARGRKQYRYHPRWREIRDSVKYQRMSNGDICGLIVIAAKSVPAHTAWVMTGDAHGYADHRCLPALPRGHEPGCKRPVASLRLGQCRAPAPRPAALLSVVGTR